MIVIASIVAIFFGILLLFGFILADSHERDLTAAFFPFLFFFLSTLYLVVRFVHFAWNQ